jgi:hypothetical protein
LAVIALTLSLAACSKESVGSNADTASHGVPRPESQAPAVETSGRTVVGKAPIVGGVRPIVTLDVRDGEAPSMPGGLPVLDQYSLTFFPEILFIRTGQPTEFRNNDGVLHNVRVRVAGTNVPAFNIALPIGATYRHVFDQKGLYDVLCDIHSGMSATIVAASTPYATIADPKGGFVFNDVPPGKYMVTAYLPAQKRLERDIDVGDGRTEVTIE